MVYQPRGAALQSGGSRSWTGLQVRDYVAFAERSKISKEGADRFDIAIMVAESSMREVVPPRYQSPYHVEIRSPRRAVLIGEEALCAEPPQNL
jgi:hypothetical protein